MSDSQSAVTFDRVSFKIEAQGIRVCLEGLVPLELIPDPPPEFQPEARVQLLDRLAAEFPGLISRNSVPRAALEEWRRSSGQRNL